MVGMAMVWRCGEGKGFLRGSPLGCVELRREDLDRRLHEKESQEDCHHPLPPSTPTPSRDYSQTAKSLVLGPETKLTLHKSTQSPPSSSGPPWQPPTR